MGNPFAKTPNGKWETKNRKTKSAHEIPRGEIGDRKSFTEIPIPKNGETRTGGQKCSEICESQSGFEFGRAREHSPSVGRISCANRSDF